MKYLPLLLLLACTGGAPAPVDAGHTLFAGPEPLGLGEASNYCHEQGARMLHFGDAELDDGTGAAACPDVCWTVFFTGATGDAIVTAYRIDHVHGLVPTSACGGAVLARPLCVSDR